MTLRGIQNTAHGLAYYARLQEITANNLANVSTDGFKMDRMTARLVDGGEFPVPVEALDLRQGALRDTGRELDLALDGPGFLVVRTPAGERLVRGGSLRLDTAGQLTDSDGNPVLGENGPLLVPTGKVTVERDGTVLLDGAALDRLRIETVADPSTLRKESGGRFIADAPTVAAEESVAVRQGTIEEPNGDSVLGMIDLVTIQRAYSANIDALKAMDGVLGTIAGEVGRV